MSQKTGKAMGGTELIEANIRTALPDLCSKVQIIMSRPEQVELEDKPRVLILQDLPQDPASSMLRDASYRTRFNRIVFCSHYYVSFDDFKCRNRGADYKSRDSGF